MSIAPRYSQNQPPCHQALITELGGWLVLAMFGSIQQMRMESQLAVRVTYIPDSHVYCAAYF